MIQKDGFVIYFDEGYRNDLVASIKSNSPFSDAFNVKKWKIKRKQVVLLSFDGLNIDYICLGTKGKKVVTGKSRVEFSDFVKLNNIAVKSIEQDLGSHHIIHFLKSSSGNGGRVPEGTWHVVLAYFKKMDPEKRSEIDRLISIANISNYSLYGNSTEILIQEREAFGSALDIFSGSNELRKDVLGSWAPDFNNVKIKDDNNQIAELLTPNDQYSCFLSGISERFIQEESAIQHDLSNWAGEIGENILGVSTFNQGNRKLNIVYANRNDLEHTLGVDLIYYHSGYNSFILVQYKLMSDKNRKNEFIFRPNAQLYKELKRMNNFNDKFPTALNIETHEQFRLNSDGFLFKLIPNEGLQAAKAELIKGMYITREYMNFIVGKNGPKGPKNGKFISFKNSPRYLTNSEFCSFVNKGWIGSNTKRTNILREIIRNYLHTGRALMLAEEKQLT